MAQSVGAVALDIVMGKNTVSDAVSRVANDAKKSFSGMSGNVSAVNKALKETQGDLSEVDRLLKIDPRNTVLLEQKQRMLNSAISDTRSKLSELQSASEQANRALANGDITQSQYDALQREIIETEQDLKSLEEQAKRTSPAMLKVAQTSEDFKNLGSKVSAVGDSVSAVGKKMLPASVAVSALGTGMVKTAADFDSAMSQVSAISGATGKDFDALRDKALEMGAKTKFSASQSAEAMTYMAMAGWKTEDMIDGIAGIMNLASASGEDLATTSDIVTDALTAFGLQASDSGHFADVLAEASSNANTNVAMMGETFKYVAPVAGAMGYSVEDMSVAIGLMANSGIKGSQAGTALRSTISRLAKPTKESENAMNALGLSIQNQDGTMKSFGEIMVDMRGAFAGLTEDEKAFYAAQLGGQEAMSGLLAIVNSSEEDFNKLSSAINNADGTAEKMSATMNNNLNGQITLLKSQIEGLAIQLGEYLVPIVSDVVSAISKLADWFGGLDDGTKKMIVTIGLVVAAVGPVLLVVGKTISVVGGAISAIGTIGGALSGFIGLLTGTIVPAISGFFAFLLANPIVLVITGIIAAGALLIKNWDKIKETASNVWNGVKETVSGVAENVKNTVSEKWNNIKEKTSEAWNDIKVSYEEGGGGIAGITEVAFDTVKNIVSSRLDSISEKTGVDLSAIKDKFTDSWFSIRNTVVDKLYEIQTSVTNISSQAVNAGVNAFNRMKTGVSNAMAGVKNAIVNGMNNAISFIKRLPAQALQWGRDMVMGIVKGIKGAIGKVGEAVNSVASKIRSVLHFSVPDEGPLTDYESWMPDFIGGMAKGIESNKYRLLDAVHGMAGEMRLPAMTAPALQNVGRGNTTMQTGASGGGGDDRVIALLTQLVNNMQNMTFTLPVYLGNDIIDEQIVKADDRRTVRSGGRV